MTLQRTHGRGGVALLLALVALAGLSAAGVAALRTASAASSESRRLSDRDEAAEIVDALAPLLARWAAKGGPVTPEGKSLPIADGTVVFERRRDELAISVEAVDLAGRLRVDRAHGAAGKGLPEAVRALLPLAPSEAIDRRSAAVPGEIARRPLLEERLTAPGFGEALFPRAGVEPRDAPAFWLTTHGAGVLNIRTAPVDLLRAALVGAPPGAARAALEARTAGDPIDGAAAAELVAWSRGGRGGEPGGRTPLTTESDAVGFFVTVRHGGLARRWWLVATRDASGSPTRASESGWTIAERRRVTP